MYRLLTFDLDGTLIDTMDRYAEIAAEVMEKHGRVPKQEGKRRYLETSGNPFFLQLQEIFPKNDVDRDAMNQEFETEKAAYFEEAVRGGPAIEKATIQVLRRLQSAGFRLCISSNNYQELVDILSGQFPGLFEEALGYREGFGKGREHFTFLSKKFGVTSKEVCFVGDSLRDAEKAKECGISFIALAGTFPAEVFEAHYPEYPVAQSFVEISSLLGISG